MTLDEIEWNPAATGVGSLLMTERGLPRDELGHPYQPLFWFAGGGTILGLVVDADDHVLAWGGDCAEELADPPECQRVPDAIERAARKWWSEQETTGP